MPRLLPTLILALSFVIPSAVNAQGVLSRSVNLTDGWVGEPGTIHFNFDHRFRIISDKVVNSPSFLLAASLPGDLLAGAWYASRSDLVSGRVNEWEAIARWAPLRGSSIADAVEPAVTLAYNGAAESVDGEVAVRRGFALGDGVPLDSIGLLGAIRGFSDVAHTGESAWFWGGGIVLHLTERISLAGDGGRLELDDREVTEVWGAALQFRIPTTPHTLSLKASNTNTASLQGSSLGGRTSWGFEFTVPITLSRYFPGPSGGESGTPRVTEAVEDSAVEVAMNDDLDFVPRALTIQAGQTVVWRNVGELAHTVTADPEAVEDGADRISLPNGAAAFDSGLVGADGLFSHTFTEPGEYRYICVPHLDAGMVGTIIVED